MFHKIKNLFKFEVRDMPPALKSKTNSYYILGGGFLLLGVVFGLLFKSFKVMGLPIVCGLALIILGASFAFSVKHAGYITKSGRCIDYDNRITTLLGSKRKGADYFILETADEVIKVPVTQRKAAPPLDSFVEIYVEKNALTYNSDGYTVYTPVFGFSVIAEGGVKASI